MVYSDTWNIAFEALPADGELANQGADKLRDLKLAIRERLEKDHYWPPAGTDADHGEHVVITLREQGSNPANAADKGKLYTKDIGGVTELFYLNSNNVVTQLTSGGGLMGAIPAGTKMIFYADIAPTGWAIMNADEWDDISVILSKGNAAGSAMVGGSNLAGGTWQQANCTLTGAQSGLVAHTHTLGAYGPLARDLNGGSFYPLVSGYGPVSTDSSGSANASSAHNHGNTWRPKAKVFIVCEKS